MDALVSPIANVTPKSAAAKKGKPRHVARHLFHGDCGYYARMAVPDALRAVVGKKELWKAIRANSDADARRKLPRVVAAFQAEIETGRERAKATRLQTAAPRYARPLAPAELAAAHYSAQMRFDDECRNTDHRYAHGFVDEDYVARLRDIVSGSADNQMMVETLGRFVRHYQKSKNLTAHFGTAEWRAALRALAVAELESLARTAERDDGDFTGQPSDPLLAQKPAPAPAKDALAVRCLSDESTKSLSEIVPDFIKERGATSQTDYESQLTARWFEQCMGEAKPIYRITRQDVHGFKRALAELPTNSTRRFPGLTLLDAIKANKARKAPFPLMNPRTINEKYLSKLNSLFGWCVRNDIIPDNPAAGIKIDYVKDKSKAPRINFSPGDLTKIFSADRFDTSKPFDERQWAQLMALFTGARASELAQIQLDSVRHQRGCLVVAIEEDTKTASSQRVVPVHSKLIELGLEKRVAELRAKGATHLFPIWYRKGMEAKARAQKAGKVVLNHFFPRFIPKVFNSTTLPRLGVDDSRKTWHSFRHTFKTGLRDGGVEKAMRDDLCGHEDNSAGAVYLHGESIEAMKIAIEKLQFDGFVIAPTSRGL